MRNPVRRIPIDWQRVTLMLRRHYKPLCTVAKEVGCDWRHICRLARGEVAEPRYTVGVHLLELFGEHVPEDRR